FLLCYIILVIPRHSTYTLFPYTTLFRSRPGGNYRDNLHGESFASAFRPRRGEAGSVCFYGTGGTRRVVSDCRGHENPSGLPRERDRKSTRLNSSHDQISYAVFCLKKKII